MDDGGIGPKASPRRSRRAGGPTSHDPIDLAMDAEASGRTPQGVAHRVLEKQERLIGWQIASERAGFALKAGGGLLGLAALILLAVLVVNASRADGLVVEPFSVPPALNERGVTGEVVASQLMDRLAAMAAETRAVQQRQVLSNWGGVSIQIPQTGVSLDQVERWLRQKIGHETHIRGEITADPDGRLSLVGRVGSTGLAPASGAPAELPAMITAMAESIFRSEQPVALGIYLNRTGRQEEAEALAQTLTRSADPLIRGYGHFTLALIYGRTKGDLEAAAEYRRSLPLAPGIGANNLAGLENNLGHTETAYQLQRQARAQAGKDTLQTAQTTRAWIDNYDATLAAFIGDHAASLRGRLAFEAAGRPGAAEASGAPAIANTYSRLHDIARARATLAEFEPGTAILRMNKAGALTTAALMAQDWAALAAESEAWIQAQDEVLPDHGKDRPLSRAYKARALAGLGRMEEAQALIASTPADCEPCARMRGWIAQASGDAAGADRWFAAAVRLTPSTPQPLSEWGAAKLERGDADGAIAPFQRAHRLSPRFADPLEGWGEALLAKGDARGAAARFAQAARLAPEWGRLRLKWGEALAKAGKSAEAGAQFRTAAGLFLTAAERAELARVQGAK